MVPQKPEQEFKPIRPNPFIVGNPVRDPRMFFGREAEFQEVVRRFKPSRNGALMVFCGERRSGKTSILFQILAGRLGPEFVPVLIDMQSMAVEGEIDFLSRIASEIVQQLSGESDAIDAPDFTGAPQPTVVFRAFIENVLERHRDKKLILLFDEYELFEDKIDSGVLSDNVLRILSNLMENHPTFLIFTGSQFLEERRKDYWGILAKATSHQRISYLSRPDAARLICQPVEGRVIYAEGVLDQVLRLTGGQPFYTQAVCQSLVDSLNEEKTNHATAEILDSVVERIVDTPLPQMIFLWQRLGQDQKLALALLAECLEGESQHGTADDVERVLRRSKYPLSLSKADIATALEALRADELLVADRNQPAGYRFRMDLWRLWVRRMHSVWQVMREEGIPTRRQQAGPFRAVVLALLLAVIPAAVGLWYFWPKPPPGPQLSLAPPPDAAPASGFLAIDPVPPGATVHLDGTPVRVGRFEARIPIGEHTITLQATGYMDSTFVVTLDEADSLDYGVSLSPQIGSLEVRTGVPGAEILVNGSLVGRGSASVANLRVPDNPHTVEVRHPDYTAQSKRVDVSSSGTRDVVFDLRPRTMSLTVTSEPSGARITVDGTFLGQTPQPMLLTVGTHHFQAELEEHVSVDTVLAVHGPADAPHLRLQRRPPGRLLLIGDQYADIFIDERRVGSGQLRRREEALSPGLHRVEIVFSDGTTDALAVEVPSGEEIRVVWLDKKLSIPESDER